MNPSQQDPRHAGEPATAMSPELKKRLAMAAGLVAVALASIPVLDSFSGKATDTTPGSVPVSSGRIVNKEEASAPTQPTLVIAQLPESSAPAAASTPAVASPSPATPDLNKTPAANLNHSSPAPATPAPAVNTPAAASKLPPLSEQTVRPPPPAARPALPPPSARAPADTTAPPPAATSQGSKTTAAPPAPPRQGKAANTEIDLPPAGQAAAPPLLPPATGSRAAPSGSSLGYQVQLGLFASPDNAEKLIDELKKRGIAARTETRVQLGPFSTRAEAEDAMARLKALGYQPMLVPAGSR